MSLQTDEYYYEGNFLVFTENYHLKRGYCCGNGCRHCPYQHTNVKPFSIFNWSGGKDSSLALYYILKENKYNIKSLLTSVNSAYGRISMHGVRQELLEEQAFQLGIPLHKLMLPEQPDMTEYENIMKETLEKFKKHQVSHSIFGDIFLEDLRKYREEKLATMSFEGVFPLWKKDTTELMHEFLELGFKTIVVCVDAQKLDKSFAGRIIDQQFLDDLPKNVDPCGENGEFHTFCFDGPIYKQAIRYEVGETVFREYKSPKSDSKDDVCSLPDNKNMGFWFTDLLPI